MHVVAYLGLNWWRKNQPEPAPPHFVPHILHYFLDILLTIRSNTSRVGQQEFGEGLDIAFGRIITDA